MTVIILLALAFGFLLWILLRHRETLVLIEKSIARRRKVLGLPPSAPRPNAIWSVHRWVWVQLADLEKAEQQRMAHYEKTDFTLEAIMQGMGEGVMVVDAGSKIHAANSALKGFFQLNGNVEGQTLMEIFRNGDLHELVQEASSKGQVSDALLQFTSPNLRTLVVNISTIRAPGGAPNGMVLVFHDETRLRHLENSRKEFVADVSHEIRTPLSILKGYLETLEDHPQLEEPARREILSVMGRHASRISALVEDLLQLSRLEAQEKTIERTEVDACDLTRQVVLDFSKTADDRKVELKIELPQNLPRVLANAGQLRQVFDNLVDNALKYSRPGTQVTISGKEKGASLELAVSDKGCGIPESDLPHVFERFYRVDKSRTRPSPILDSGERYYGGTGLGLSIVREIIRHHGGKTWVESELGIGSTFYFTVPLCRSVQQAPGASVAN